MDYFEQDTTEIMDWPARNPDLNPKSTFGTFWDIVLVSAVTLHVASESLVLHRLKEQDHTESHLPPD